jgi:hypothetical protein
LCSLFILRRIFPGVNFTVFSATDNDGIHSVCPSIHNKWYHV